MSEKSAHTRNSGNEEALVMLGDTGTVVRQDRGVPFVRPTVPQNQQESLGTSSLSLSPTSGHVDTKVGLTFTL